jgi:hypothetical protein
MADWNTRLAVRLTKVAGKETIIDVTPIDQFNPTFSLGAEPLHSIEETHIGVVYQPKSITFSITVRAIGGVVGRLTGIAINRERFDVILQEQSGDDWSFKSMVMSDCVITSAQPGAATVSGAPTATFSGFSLGGKIDAKDGGEHRL